MLVVAGALLKRTLFSTGDPCPLLKRTRFGDDKYEGVEGSVHAWDEVRLPETSLHRPVAVLHARALPSACGSQGVLQFDMKRAEKKKYGRVI